MDVEATTQPVVDPLEQYEMADEGTFTVKNLSNDDYLLGNDGKPVKCTCFSSGSKQGVRALHKAGLAAQMRTMRMLRGELDKNDAVKADEERAEKLAGFTKSFSANFPHSPADVCSRPKLNYIAKQIEEYVGKDANFVKGSSGS